MEAQIGGEWMTGMEGGNLEGEFGRGRRRNSRKETSAGKARRGRPRGKTVSWDSDAMMQAMEALGKLVIPQVIMPVQLKSEPEDLPEFGLLRAVLLNALAEYMDSFKPSPNQEVAERRREARQVAESWFAGDEGAAIDFELCCSMFGMSADQMRKKIGQLSRRLSAPWN